MLQHMCIHTYTPPNKPTNPTQPRTRHQPTNQPTNQPASQPNSAAYKPTHKPTNQQPTNPKTNSQQTNNPGTTAHRGGGDSIAWEEGGKHTAQPHTAQPHTAQLRAMQLYATEPNTTGTHSREEGRSNTPTSWCQSVTPINNVYKQKEKKTPAKMKGIPSLTVSAAQQAR